jgi:hypothetical protein
VFALLLGLVLALNIVAADKPAKASNLQGKVQMMSKDNSTITVEQKGGLRRQVLYSGDTKFEVGSSKSHKPGSLDQVKEGYFINCQGSYNDKTQLMAKMCVYRESK